jgi:hypothetical protein
MAGWPLYSWFEKGTGIVSLTFEAYPMFRKHLLALSLAAIALPFFVTKAQADESRTIELRLVALSRGYMQPMKATAERIKALPGMTSVEMLGFGGDMARYKVTTTLSDEGLAKALQLKLVGAAKDTVTLAADVSPRARHAEARGPLMDIALKIMAEPKPSWRGDSEALFKSDASLKDKMARLGLPYEALQGVTYTASDYHIDELWEGSGGEYRIWAGDEWEGIYVPSNDWYYDDSENNGQPTKEPDPNSRFVGIRVYRSSWQNSLTWVDQEGLLLTGFAGERDDTDREGVLCVQRGADWMGKILSAIGGFRVRNPKAGVGELPQGRGWNIFSLLSDDEEDNTDIQRWDVPQYDLQAMRLNWRDDDGHLIAVLTAHHNFHPFYLEGELDTQTVLDAHAKLTTDQRKKVRRPDLGEALKWIVGAETDVGVFQRRRDEARSNSTKILEALGKAMKTHDVDALCGKLDDAELLKRLGIELKPGEFKPGDYAIRRQMLGDVEISVGTALTGGRLWMLANPAEGKTIRSNQ